MPRKLAKQQQQQQAIAIKTSSDVPKHPNVLFQQVADIERGINAIDDLTHSIKSKYNEAQFATSEDQRRAVGADLDRLVQEFSAKAVVVNAALKAMDAETNRMDAAAAPAEVQIRRNQHQCLRLKFTSSVQAYQEMSEKFSSKYREQIKRRIRTNAAARGERVDDEQVEAMMTALVEQGTEDSIFQQCKDTLVMVQENHQDILRIERSMLELHQMMVDMALIVEEQGTLMEDIASNVTQSVHYAKKGNKEIHQAKKIAKKTRLLTCCIS